MIAGNGWKRALLLGGFSLACATAGAWQVHGWIRADRIAGSRAEIRTQAHALGAVTQTGIETLAREMVYVMDEKLRKGEGAEFDRDIFDIALWSRKDAGGKPVRTVLGLNSNYITPLQDNALRSKGAEPVEADRIERVFDGQWVISPQPTTELGSAFLVAVPASRAVPVREVVVAHVRAAYFQRFFKAESPFRAVLLNGDGRMLLGGGAQDESALGRAARAMIDKMTDNDTGLVDLDVSGESVTWWGGYRRIRSHQFIVVLAASPRSAIAVATSDLWSSARVWKGAFGMALACLFGIGAAIATAGVRLRGEQLVEAAEATESYEEIEELQKAPEKSSKLDEILNAREEQIVPTVAVTSSVVETDREPDSSPNIQMPIPGVQFEPQMTAFAEPVSTEPGSAEPGSAVDEVASAPPSMAPAVPNWMVEPAPAPAADSAATSGPDPAPIPVVAAPPAPALAPALAPVQALASVPAESALESSSSALSESRSTEAPSALAPTLSPTLSGSAPEVSESMSEQAWWVHNGAQAIGPMPPAEIAGRLFAQDLDFDCECWPDGPEGRESTIRLPIATSGLFLLQNGDSPNEFDSPAQLGDVDRPHWVFINGQGIVGPCTTEEVHRLQLPPDAYICFRSTINGWMPSAEWLRQNPLAVAKTGGDLSEKASSAEVSDRPRAA